MNDKIGFIGNPAVLPQGSKDNTGNIIHGHAARSLFAQPVQVKSTLDPANIDEVRGRITHLGFVAATMLHTRKPPKYITAMEQAAEFVEKLDLPVCTFGWGCHAYLDDTIAEANVDPRAIRLLRALADRSTTVGVRGEFTADLCAKYGVKNVSVVGCQSAYVAGMANAASPALKTTGARPVIYLSLGPNEVELLRLGMASGAGLIGQGDPTDERIATGDISREDFIANTGAYWQAPYLVAALAAGVISRADYFDYVRAHFHKFYAVEPWRAHIADSYDFCFGTRFHGNMVALQSGVPALWVVHDMRTKELCRHLNLPAILHSELPSVRDVGELAARCDYSAFWAHLPARTAEFLAYLQGNGVAGLLAPKVAADLNALISA